MTENIRVFVLAGSADWEAGLIASLHQARITVVRRCIDVADLIASSQTDAAELVFLNPHVSGLDRTVIDLLESEGLDLWSVGTAGEHLGILNHLDLRDFDQLVERVTAQALSHTAHQIAQTVSTSHRDEGVASAEDLGSVTVVWGPMGAPGCSTIALGIASSLARLGESTLLIDADVQGASIAQMLAILDDVSGLMASCRDMNLGRQRDIRDHSGMVFPDLEVLTGIPRADLWHHIRPNALGRVLEQARMSYRHVIVDCGFDLGDEGELEPTRGDVTRTLLMEADRVLLVGRPDPIVIGRLLRACEDLVDMAENVDLVINGMRPSTPWSESQIGDMLFDVVAKRPIAFLPFDAVACDNALLKGEPVTEIAPGDPLGQGLNALAGMIRSTLAPSGAV